MKTTMHMNGGADDISRDSKMGTVNSSAEEMGRGLVGLWLAGLVFFLALAVMWQGQALEGYGMLALCAVGLVIGAKHMREAARLAELEDEARDEEYRRWVDSVNGLVRAVEDEECRVSSDR